VSQPSLRALLLPASVAAACSLSCAATAPGATIAQLQYRAVFDLGCPANMLVIYPVDGRAKAVTGCGRRLVYVESCQDIRGELVCTWIMNSPTYWQTMWPGLLAPQPTVIVQQQLSPQPARPVATALFDPNAALPTGNPGMPQPAATGTAPGGPSAPATPSTAAPGQGAAPSEVEGRPYSTDLFGPTPSPRKPAKPDGRPEGSGAKTEPPPAPPFPTDLFDTRR
jgi:hypothetical protein